VEGGRAGKNETDKWEEEQQMGVRMDGWMPARIEDGWTVEKIND